MDEDADSKVDGNRGIAAQTENPERSDQRRRKSERRQAAEGAPGAWDGVERRRYERRNYLTD